jgi:uncharacterized lipoprotein YajG
MKLHASRALSLAASCIAAVLLAGCAGQPTTVVMEGPAPQLPK